MAEVSAKAWERMVAFYRELNEYGWHQGPMLEFVSWLAASPHSRILVPSTSHEALGLARVATYRDQPMVYIVFSESRGFVIHWRHGQWDDDVREESVPSPQAPEVFARILAWLGAPREAEPGAAANGGA